MVVGRGDACVETYHHGDDRAQNDQEQLNDLSSTMPTFSPIVSFARRLLRGHYVSPRPEVHETTERLLDADIGV
jgi:hypothetical protein